MVWLNVTLAKFAPELRCGRAEVVKVQTVGCYSSDNNSLLKGFTEIMEKNYKKGKAFLQ